MKIIGNLLLLVLMVSSMGCITGGTIQRGRGYTEEYVPVSVGDATFTHDYTRYVIKRVYAPGETNVIRHVHAPAKLHLVTSDETVAFAYKPNPAYYLLVPLTVPADILTSPFQLWLLWIFRNGVYT